MDTLIRKWNNFFNVSLVKNKGRNREEHMKEREFDPNRIRKREESCLCSKPRESEKDILFP